MNKYVYTAINNKTNKKERDTVEASSLEEAKQLIKMSNKTLISLEEANIFNSDLHINKKVKATDLAIFCQQMKSMLAAGVTAVDAISLSATSTSNKTLKNALNSIVTKIGQGSSMAQAFGLYNTIFPDLMVSMIAAGEESGAAEEVFDRLGTQFEKSAKTKKSIKKATSYPKLLGVVVFIVAIVMCTFILPKFKEVFDSMGAELPALTLGIMALGDFIRIHWFAMILVVVVAVVIFRIWSSSEKGRHTIDTLKLKIPVLKDLEKNTASANLARVLSTLLASGMYLPKALEIACNTMTNSIYYNAVNDIKTDVTNGITLTDSMEKTNLFPPLMLNLISIGEKTGDMTNMLSKSAKYFEDEVDSVTDQLTSLLQPVVILFMAAIVGIMIYSLYGPMMNMYDGIG